MSATARPGAGPRGPPDAWRGWPFDGERVTPQVNAEGADPILVVGGTGDSITPYTGAQHMARALGDGWACS